ncbi:hypothetical protein A3H10_02595 [Candidatus Uhrbacteria bacterium RIFCSPLOWO2_12_FULL_46_10]|uniref:Metal-dependent hydrolase n=1 Tax=Candidatus Uhrbacteria bacterium RIFCSPLOWO2_01_FULL_47_25 TaxID=1802402 RepID=A0A1F7UWP5_9BACT|nr:MAG: hypothetical protein UX68_C0013G0002 [Parcubacteria group bacterium GW2011_GWA2_46_9]OGL82138.1 MAG: hypothetical protein A2936_01075 [Candidatus Uhrbacteria bacterium RIFCSPLOWO2_01_FULL_47_25]OGL91397.1 MAG: hypothetical protein A3H10_02595 [Candidatus Uhrbacteria bacterium RIFCSPLOWO2_12_FULL_46_10]
MDTLAHGLWANVIYQRQRAADRWWAIFFGVAPDLFSFGPFMISRILFGTFGVGRPEVESIPLYVSFIYNYTHSAVIFLVVFGLVALWRSGKIWWPLAAWGLHILIDIGTHTYEFFPTPFLFPLSSWKVNAINWADPTFMIVNYSLLVLAYLEIYRRRLKSKFKS